MVLATGTTIAVLIGTGGAAAPLIAEGVAAGMAGTGFTAAGASATTAVVTSAGTAAAAGSLTAAAGAGATAAGVAAGGATAGATAGSISALGSGLVQLTTIGAALGPIGWTFLGASAISGENRRHESVKDVIAPPVDYSWDCWKPIVRNTTVEPSEGRMIRDVLTEDCIKSVTFRTDRENSQLVQSLAVTNVWDEKFIITFLTLDTGRVVAHAERVDI